MVDLWSVLTVPPANRLLSDVLPTAAQWTTSVNLPALTRNGKRTTVAHDENLELKVKVFFLLGGCCGRCGRHPPSYRHWKTSKENES